MKLASHPMRLRACITTLPRPLTDKDTPIVPSMPLVPYPSLAPVKSPGFAGAPYLSTSKIEKLTAYNSRFLVRWDVPLPSSSPASVLPTEQPNLVLGFRQWESYDLI